MIQVAFKGAVSTVFAIYSFVNVTENKITITLSEM